MVTGALILDPEQLYWAFRDDGVESRPLTSRERKLAILQNLRIPDASMDRSSLGSPGRLRARFPGHSIMAFAASCLHFEYSVPGPDPQSKLVFRPEADPLEDNPAHVEIRLYRDGERIGHDATVPKGAKRRFREQLAECAEVEWVPSQAA